MQSTNILDGAVQDLGCSLLSNDNVRSAVGFPRYFVIPLSIQKEGDLYTVGSADVGDFYQLPGVGVRIIKLLGAGDAVATIKARLRAENLDEVDVDQFVNQLTDIGFIYTEDQRKNSPQRLQDPAKSSGRTFNVDARLAKAIFSTPVLACYLVIVLLALADAIENPALRLNSSALYIETNRTPLLATVLFLSLIQTAMHELGHMLAAARHGVKSKYGIGNRLWTIVAESDLTGILTLPKSQRYLPMLAGLIVDILLMSLLTILLDILSQHSTGPFVIQVVQVLILETVIGMAWQFNVFVKTDIYFVLCNYFSYPDLDKDARTYLLNVLHKVTLGRFGRETPHGVRSNLIVLQTFSLVWVFGRVLSLVILFTVFLPTMWRYIESAGQLMWGPPASVWMACDTILYVTFMMSILGTGMYMWIKHR